MAAKAKDLPVDLIRDIFAQLPDMKSLCRFKSISKPCHSIIIEEIKRREPKLIILSTRINYPVFSIDLNSPDYLEEHHFPDEILDGSSIILRGSCNGLILFTTYYNIILWNKFLGDFQVITQRPRYKIPKYYSKGRRCLLYGFGYDPGNDVYKVVEIMCFYRGENGGPRGHDIRVYSLKQKTWQSPQNAGRSRVPCIYDTWYNVTKAVLVGSALNWVAYLDYKSKTAPFVFAFDLTAEEFHEIELPEKTKATVLGVLGGCLTVTHPKNDIIDIWVMKEYMVQESWTNLFRISILDRDVYAYHHMRPLSFSRDGNKVLLDSGCRLLWYDPGNDRLDAFDINEQLESINGAAICFWPTNQVIMW